MVSSVAVVLLVFVSATMSQSNQDWHVGVDRVRQGGTVVHGHANVPIHRGSDGRLNGNVHGSRVFGGPSNGHHSVGGGLQYQHNNGLHGGLDATHNRGQGTTYTGTVGGHTRVGPGTLSVDGGAIRGPHSSKVQGYAGAKYSVQF